jgi:hypothetical protein
VFRAGVVPERPQKVGRGPLRSLRPGASAPDPTLRGSSGSAVPNRLTFGSRTVATRR